MSNQTEKPVLLQEESRVRMDRLVGRLFIVAILFFGGVIFAMPFLDMMFTSMKTDDEVALEHYRFMPKTPKARWVSPYVADDPDTVIERPADMSEKTWSKLEKPYRESIRTAVATWWDEREFIKTHYAGVDRDQALDVLTEAVGSAVLKRLPDSSREAGVDAMVKEAGKLATDATIFPEFKVAVPRFVLGDVRVRIEGFSQRTAGKAGQWQLVSGPAKLAPSVRPLDAGMQASYDIPSVHEESAVTFRVSMLESQPPAAAMAIPALAADEAAGVNRVHVGFLPDRSWAKIDLYVIRQGQRFRMRGSGSGCASRYTRTISAGPRSNCDGRTPTRTVSRGGRTACWTSWRPNRAMPTRNSPSR
jgi:hypothetical protein